MTEALAHAAISAGVDGRASARSRRLIVKGYQSLLSPETDYQRIVGKSRRDQDVLCRSKAEVYIIPEDCCVAAVFRRRARYNRAMGMTFYDFTARLKRNIIKRIRKLAEPATHRRDQTSLTKLAATDVTRGPLGLAHLFPKAKNLTGWNFHQMQTPAGFP